MDLDRLIDGITDLRHASFARHPEYRADDAAWSEMRRFVTEACRTAGTEGRDVLTGPGGVRAALVLWYEPESWYGAPVQRCLVDYELDDAEAREWLLDALSARAPELGGDFDLALDAHYAPALDRLLGMGFHVDSVTLLGDPARSLAHLVGRYDPPRRLTHLGLQIEPMRTQAQADAVLELKRTTFAREPQFCWFGANEAYLDAERRALEQPAEPGTVRWVVTDGARVLGFVGSDLQPDNALWGRCAGVDLVLAPEIRRRGIVKTAYRRLLEHWLAHEVDVFKGGTSQPAVLGLGALMDRTHLATYVRARGYFPPEHFAPFVRV